MTSPYWLNKDSRTFLQRDYLLPGVTPEQRIRQIAEAAQGILGIEGFADRFESYMHKGWYSLSTPIWINFGLDRGLPISCNGSYIGDSMQDIWAKLTEVGTMTQYGAGTSAYFGDIRPRGTPIKGGANGKASGPVQYMQLFETAMAVVSQGNARRGSFAAYLPIEHPDVGEFLGIRDEGHPIQSMSFGVCIGDQWMIDMIAGDKAKRGLWIKLVQKKLNSGYPYLVYSDTANKAAPKVYRDKGKTIHASNLCVAPETRLLTKDGHWQIRKLEGKEVEVWNGKQWSKTTVVKTGEKQPLIEVRISIMTANHDHQCGTSGVETLHVTPYHRFYLKDGSEVRASDLKGGEKLLAFQTEDETWSFPRVYSAINHGRFDDTYCVNEPLEHKAVFNEILTGNCSEIMLSSDQAESFVCNLSSLNILHYEDWKDTDAVQTLTYFLDAVMSEYIDKTRDLSGMEAPHRFAVNQRALGVGVLGWHSYLQSKMIAFESMEAKLLNTQIHKVIRDKSWAASREMATLYGEPPLLRGYGMRNVTTMAIAPTTSSSFILGQVSPSIEPLKSNYFVKNLAKGGFAYRNPYLQTILEAKGRDNPDVWNDILVRGGSVQHLDFLSNHEKAVFKTFEEISAKEIVIQAAARQKYIDQGQSLNLLVPISADPKDFSKLMIFAWEQGVKSLYYTRGENPAQQLARNLLTCVSCEG